MKTVDFFPHAFACECGRPILVQRHERAKPVMCLACKREHGPFDVGERRTDLLSLPQYGVDSAPVPTDRAVAAPAEVFSFYEDTGPELIARLAGFVETKNGNWTGRELAELEAILDQLQRRISDEFHKLNCLWPNLWLPIISFWYDYAGLRGFYHHWNDRQFMVGQMSAQFGRRLENLIQDSCRDWLRTIASAEIRLRLHELKTAAAVSNAPSPLAGCETAEQVEFARLLQMFPQDPHRLPGKLTALTTALLVVMERLDDARPDETTGRLRIGFSSLATDLFPWCMDAESQQAVLQSIRRRPTQLKMEWLSRFLRDGHETIDGEELGPVLESLAADPAMPANIHQAAKRELQFLGFLPSPLANAPQQNTIAKLLVRAVLLALAIGVGIVVGLVFTGPGGNYAQCLEKGWYDHAFVAGLCEAGQIAFIGFLVPFVILFLLSGGRPPGTHVAEWQRNPGERQEAANVLRGNLSLSLFCAAGSLLTALLVMLILQVLALASTMLDPWSGMVLGGALSVGTFSSLVKALARWRSPKGSQG